MDEILASIRRIIESGDDRSALAPGLRAANQRRGEAVADAEPPRTGRAQQVVADAQSLAHLLSRTAQSPRASTPARADAESADFEGLGEIRGSLDHDAAEPVQPRLADAGRPRARVPYVQPVREGAVFDDLSNIPAAPKDVAAELARNLGAHATLPRELHRAAPAGAPEPVDESEFDLDFDEERYAAELQAQASRGLAVEEPMQEAPAPIHGNGKSGDRAGGIGASVEGEDHDRFLTYLAASAEAGETARLQSEPTTMIAETSALISDRAGEQVAAAFDDLARAIRDGQMRSMEDMAREMLRPMLQEWLDDNLPRLVEKMVREEIERVSRGGRR